MGIRIAATIIWLCVSYYVVVCPLCGLAEYLNEEN